MKLKKITGLVLIGLLLFMLCASVAAAQEDGTTDEDSAQEEAERTQGMIAIGIGLAVGISGIASSLGVGIAGSAGCGVIAENPDYFGKSLVLQALPMTQSIYGLLTGILLMLGSGILGELDVGLMTSPVIGLAAIGIGLIVGLTGISAIPQGITSAAGISAYARNEETFAKSIIFSVMSETMAIFGLLAAILIMSGLALLGG